MKKARLSGTTLQPSKVRNHTLNNGDLSVYCWCQHAIVYVTPKAIAEGRTASCGRPACNPINTRATGAA